MRFSCYIQRHYLCSRPFQAVTNLLNNENISDIDRVRLVMLYALRYEKESPVQLMQLFNKLASRSAKYKTGVMYTFKRFFNQLFELILLYLKI